MSGEYDFCPKCGALMHDGVCQSCGYGKGDAQGGEEIRPEEDGRQQDAAHVQTEGMQDTVPERNDFQEETNNYYTPLGSGNMQGGQSAYQGGQSVYQGGQSVYQGGQPVPGAGMQGSGNNRYENNPGGGSMPPYGSGNMYSGNQPGNNKKNNTGTIIAICSLGALLLILVIVGGIFAQKAIRRAVDERRVASIHRRYDYDDYDDDDYYDDDYDDYDDDDYDDYDYDDYDDDYGVEYGVTPDAKYYDGLVDSIDYSVDYDIDFEEFDSITEGGYSDNLEFNIVYVTLEGDQIPHLNEINRQLQEYSTWYIDVLEEEAEDYPDEDFYMSSYAYVTYNDDQQISIVLSETIMLDYDYYVDLYAINIDLVNGTILNNTDMIRVDDDLVLEFREKSIEQNGDDFPNLTDEDIFDYMTDEDSLILFYTPVGLEVGINYVDDDGYSGWITVTYKEYQNLLRKSG